MNFFNLSLKLNGFPIEDAKRKLAEIQAIPTENYQEHIENQKRAIFRHHFETNVFYKRFVNHNKDLEWSSLPIMTKKDLQQPLQNRLSKGFTPKNCYINKTSGSSGTPFIFAKDKFCHALNWANFIDRYNWFEIDLATSKQARFYGIPLNKKGYYKERLKDTLGNRFRFSVFDLSDEKLEHNLEKFKSTTFEYLNGYTSSIVQFAKYLQRKNLVLKTLCPSLKLCIVTSEMLFDTDRVLLEKYLGIPVVNEYGAAELGLIAFQNTSKEWLLNSEDLFIEVLDNNNNPLPLGETGKIVVTSLYNKAHPFIRYELGDIGRLSIKNTTKKPILELLEGRTSDLVSLPSGKTAAGLTFYYVTKSVIDDAANVKEFVIEQLTLNTFKIVYVSDDELSEENIADIHKAVIDYLEPNLKLTFERKTEIKRSKSGKLKQFTSHL